MPEKPSKMSFFWNIVSVVVEWFKAKSNKKEGK